MPRLYWFLIWVVFLSLSAGSCLHVLCNLFRNLTTWFLHIILCVIFVYGTHMGVRVCMHMCGRKPEAGIGYFPLVIWDDLHLNLWTSLVLASGRCLYLLRLLALVILTNFMCIVIIDEDVHIVNQSSELFSTYKTGLCSCWHALRCSLVLEFEPATSCMLDKTELEILKPGVTAADGVLKVQVKEVLFSWVIFWL